MVIQRETKCVQNKQKLNGQFMKKKYNKKNTRKMKGKIQEKGKKGQYSTTPARGKLYRAMSYRLY